MKIKLYYGIIKQECNNETRTIKVITVMKEENNVIQQMHMPEMWEPVCDCDR
jgi:hypothetical protein